MTQAQTSNGAAKKKRTRKKRPSKATKRRVKKVVEEVEEKLEEAQQAQPDLSKMTFAVQGPLLQATLNYLATRPYQEVFKLVAALQQVQSIDDK